jgi:hypothetical protein
MNLFDIVKYIVTNEKILRLRLTELKENSKKEIESILPVNP